MDFVSGDLFVWKWKDFIQSCAIEKSWLVHIEDSKSSLLSFFFTLFLLVTYPNSYLFDCQTFPASFFVSPSSCCSNCHLVPPSCHWPDLWPLPSTPVCLCIWLLGTHPIHIFFHRCAEVCGCPAMLPANSALNHSHLHQFW